MSSTTSTVLNKPIVRDSGIEMLRMLAACGVVILHYNGSIALSLVREGSMNSYILLFLEGLFICAVFAFLLFKQFTFKSRLINTLSKSAFTCFLIHGIFLSRIKIELFVNASPILLLLHILASAVAIYLVSFAVWAIYDFVTKPIFKLLGSKLGRLDALLSTEQSI